MASEPTLTYEEWYTIDSAFWACHTIDDMDKAFVRLHSLLMRMGLASSESNTYKELADIARRWISTHYISDVSPKEDARRLWEYWCEKYHGDIEGIMGGASLARVSNSRLGYVYVLKMGDWYKIGRSIDPLSRFPQIAVRMPIPTRLWMTFCTNDMYEAEAELHRYYAPFHTNGEWFRIPEYEIRNLYIAQPYLDSYCLPRIVEPAWRQANLTS